MILQLKSTGSEVSKDGNNNCTNLITNSCCYDRSGVVKAAGITVTATANPAAIATKDTSGTQNWLLEHYAIKSAMLILQGRSGIFVQ